MLEARRNKTVDGTCSDISSSYPALQLEHSNGYEGTMLRNSASVTLVFIGQAVLQNGLFPGNQGRMGADEHERSKLTSMIREREPTSRNGRRCFVITDRPLKIGVCGASGERDEGQAKTSRRMSMDVAGAGAQRAGSLPLSRSR